MTFSGVSSVLDLSILNTDFLIMARFRRYVRRSFRPKRNAERVIRGGTSTIATGTQQVAYTYTARDACVAKSIKLDVGVTTPGSATSIPYVLVLVQEGYNANQIIYPALTDDMYNPTMNVLISGVITDPVVEDHKFNMVGRKMKPGDRLALIFYNAANLGSDVTFEINFSVLT